MRNGSTFNDKFINRNLTVSDICRVDSLQGLYTQLCEYNKGPVKSYINNVKVIKTYLKCNVKSQVVLANGALTRLPQAPAKTVPMEEVIAGGNAGASHGGQADGTYIIMPPHLRAACRPIRR